MRFLDVGHGGLYSSPARLNKKEPQISRWLPDSFVLAHLINEVHYHSCPSRHCRKCLCCSHRGREEGTSLSHRGVKVFSDSVTPQALCRPSNCVGRDSMGQTSKSTLSIFKHPIDSDGKLRRSLWTQQLPLVQQYGLSV